LSPEPIDLVPVVRQVLDELEDANPDWVLSFDIKGATVGRWDADRLAQVFSNLVANAIQHGDVAGGVRVSLDGTSPGTLRAEVHNLGVIADELLPRLFEPLAGGQRRRDGSRGLGLGLYITREVVKAHGGVIAVRSDETSGTTFAFDLPRATG
jgi:signal transduction histidine kinase